MAGEHCIAMTTTGDEASASALARDVVAEGLAACVQVVAIRSVYRWDGAIQDAPEQLLLMKTRVDRYDRLETFVRERHPYELPEIVRIPIDGGLGSYLAWIDAETSVGG